ncbi:MAG TPA: hypothetical protein VGD43_13390 [Micromonospora sp.]
MRTRPVAHTALTTVLRAGRTSVDLTRLARTIGLTRDLNHSNERHDAQS